LIHKLKKKYGTTIPEILAYRETRAGELEALTASEHNVKELDKK